MHLVEHSFSFNFITLCRCNVVYPFISWRTFALFPVWEIINKVIITLAQSFFVCEIFFYLIWINKCGIAVLCNKCMFNCIKTSKCFSLFFYVTVPLLHTISLHAWQHVLLLFFLVITPNGFNFIHIPSLIICLFK